MNKFAKLFMELESLIYNDYVYFYMKTNQEIQTHNLVESLYS